jgi:uncharacterized protein (DUF342 family)
VDLFTNDYFTLSADKDTVAILVNKPHFPLKDFDAVLKKVPRLLFTNFANLRNALAQASGESVEIGTLKPLIELQISRDFMEASIRLNMTEEELEERKPLLPEEIMELLKAYGVIDGISFHTLKNELLPQQSIVVAQGIPPEPGTDAAVSYFSFSERRPTIREDGNADYYELHFIDEVQPGQWLGEKIPATPGKSGRNLAGISIPGQGGKDQQLHYDKQSVSEHEEDGKIVLRSKLAGVVLKHGKKITVQELLTITGDVGPKTGNIDFTGSIQITGTVQDGYMVTATKDISILGEIGIGAVERIVSKQGDIYVKGGVFGKERAVIQAGRNVYLKHAKDCSIESGESIHIGLYAINCKLLSKYIYLDKRRGRLIGGLIQAKVQLVTAYIGNESERPTKVLIEGFDRSHIMKQLEAVLQEYKSVLADLEHMRKEVDVYEGYVDMLKDSQKKEYLDFTIRYEQAAEKILALEDQRKKMMAYMNAKGDGEVAVLERAFPRTMLQIKELEKRIERITAGSFYVEKNVFFHE